MTRVSLCMPTWNGGELLEEVLTAIDRQPGIDRVEKLAIDSGSRDDTVDRLLRHGFTVETIDQRDFDHGRTRDAMLDAATGDVCVLLTQDATPADDHWLAALVASFDDPETGAAYCKQLPRPDCNPFIRRRITEWVAGKDQPVVQACASAEEFARLEPMQRLTTCAYDNVAGAVRRAAWARHRFGSRAFGEDVAFGKRLILDGWKIVFQARSAVVHSHNRTAKEEGKRIYCDHQNLRDLFDVHLLPGYANYTAAVDWSAGEYARIVDELALPHPAHDELRRWAIAYGHWASLGMHLGANSAANLASPAAPLFELIDRRLHGGI